MKKIFSILLIFIIAAAFLAGCQATPSKPAVVQKDMKQMIKKAQQSSAQGTETRSLREQLNIPDTLSTELVSAKAKLKIHVNANIIVPDITAIPAVRIGMSSFTQDDVKLLYKMLCGDAMPIKTDRTLVYTKSYKMRSIQNLIDQKKIGKMDKYSSMEELDLAIKKVMQEASKLPDHFERAEPDFLFKAFGDSDGSEVVHLRVAPDDATISDLNIINTPAGIGQSRVEYYRELFYQASLSSILNGASDAFLQTESPYFQPPSMNEDAARKLAENTISALGLKDFICSGHRIDALYNLGVDAEDAPRKGVYEYIFTRQFGGVTITCTNDDGAMIDGDKIGKASYTAPWLYEKVRIIIDDIGVLCFVWHSPYVVRDAITNTSAMLPFKDIQNTFEKMIPMINNFYDTSNQGVTCDMYVTEVRLGLMRITEKDIGTSGLVIPVWDFMGYTKDSQSNVNGKDGYNSLLTINAIDGSIIDRSLGY